MHKKDQHFNHSRTTEFKILNINEEHGSGRISSKGAFSYVSVRMHFRELAVVVNKAPRLPLFHIITTMTPVVLLFAVSLLQSCETQGTTVIF